MISNSGNLEFDREAYGVHKMNFSASILGCNFCVPGRKLESIHVEVYIGTRRAHSYWPYKRRPRTVLRRVVALQI